VGTLVDRFGPRRVLFVSTVLQALGMLCITLGSSSVMMFGLMFVVASMLGCAQAPVPFSYVIVGWFRARRGIAMGMTFTFAGLGIAIVPPLAALLIESFGWRTAYALLGAGALCVSLPSAIWLIVDPPAVEKREAGNLPGLTLREAMRQPAFWLLAAAFLLNAIVATAGSISLPTVLGDRGVEPTTAALAMSVVGVALIVGRLGAGLLLDRFPAVPITAILFLSPVVGHVLMAFGVEGYGVVLAAIMFGFATGAEGDAMSYVLSRMFGMRHFGKIMGINFFGYAFGTGLGPFLVNWLHSISGGYAGAFALMAVAAAVAAIGVAALWRHPLPYR
jgi:MFS family permease